MSTIKWNTCFHLSSRRTIRFYYCYKMIKAVNIYFQMNRLYETKLNKNYNCDDELVFLMVIITLCNDTYCFLLITKINKIT